MTPEEEAAAQEEAYTLAEERIAEAKAEGHKLLNLSSLTVPEDWGVGQRMGDARLDHLARLPAQLMELISLETLLVFNNTVFDINSLSSLVGLKRLHLERTDVSDLRPLTRLTELRGLFLNGSPLHDILPLANMTELETVYLSETPLTDISPLAAMTRLEYLSLDNTPLSDVSHLMGMPKLRDLRMEGTNADDLSPLTDAITLKRLYVSRTRVRELEPIANLIALEDVRFNDIPACEAEPELKVLSEILDDEERTQKTLAWLRARRDDNTEPENQRSEGPQFEAPQEAPVRLIQPNMDQADDPEQRELHEECRIKAEVLVQVAPLGGNQQPGLVAATDRYRAQIRKDAQDIGARMMWSVANALAALWEAHQIAEREGRLNEVLPPQVAQALKDLVETNSVWFMGHPGARQIEEWLRESPTPSDEEVEMAGRVVDAADAAPNVVDPDAIQPARSDQDAAGTPGQAGRKGRRGVVDWAYNLVAVIARTTWRIGKSGAKWGSLTVGSHDLIQFILGNKTIIGQFAVKVMPTAPVWFDRLISMLQGLI